MRQKKLVLILLTALLLSSGAVLAKDFTDYFPTEVDPFMGNFTGRWCEEEDVDPDIAAQVIARGRGRYEIRLVSKLFMRCPPLAIIKAKAEGDVIRFKDQGYYGEITKDAISGGKKLGRKTFEMKRYIHSCDRMGAKPPEGGIVLFDGSNFDHWTGTEDWEILEGGVAMVTPKAKYLETKKHYKDVQIHLEFRLPYMPTAKGQQRGNSGIFSQQEYEVQILDSFGLEGYYVECGALYKVAAPIVNACLPPLSWQVYDITFRAPRFDEAGKMTELPRITAWQNGYIIQKDQELKELPSWKEHERLAPHPQEPGPIRLQGHNNYVQFRNIWMVDLSEK